MNEVYQNMLNRRSIRKFRSDIVKFIKLKYNIYINERGGYHDSI